MKKIKEGKGNLVKWTWSSWCANIIWRQCWHIAESDSRTDEVCRVYVQSPLENETTSREVDAYGKSFIWIQWWSNWLEGIITLPMTLGTNPRHLNLKIDFIVVKVLSAYNMILGRPYNNVSNTITTEKQKISFPSLN